VFNQLKDAMHTFNCEKAVSAVFSVLLLVIITFVAGIFLYSFISGMMENMTDSSSPNQLFSLRIENIAVNDTCMTICVGNSCGEDVAISRVYINNEPKEICQCAGSGEIIPKFSAGAVQIVGTYTAGCSYDIKVIFTSGTSLISYIRY
jgi:flagellin-like protein